MIVNQAKSTPVSRLEAWRSSEVTPLRIGTISHAGRINPYLDLFYRALAPHGYAWDNSLDLNDEWLAAHARGLAAVHLHWPELAVRQYGRGFPQRLHAVVGLIRFFRLARDLGVRVIWTVHELFPENADWLERMAYRWIAQNADLVIFHSGAAAAAGIRTYGRMKRLVVMPHGNYMGVYPRPRPRSQVLREFGLDAGRPIIACLGHILAYKGFDLAAEAVAQLDGRCQLIIAGPAYPSSDVGRLASALGDRGVVIGRRTSDQEFADIASVSAAVLLPYRTVTTSGAMLAACSLGCGVICSDLPFFREVLGPVPAAGEFFSTGDASDLARAIERYLDRPAIARRTAARHLAAEYGWERCIEPVAAVLSEWRRESPVTSRVFG